VRYPHSKVNELQRFFEERYRWVQTGNIPSCVDRQEDISRGAEWMWTLFMNQFDCVIVEEEDLVESFADMVNFGEAVRTHVCLHNPAGDGFLLVPPELAERVLVMGALV
jgi:hypothetical protein